MPHPNPDRHIRTLGLARDLRLSDLGRGRRADLPDFEQALGVTSTRPHCWVVANTTSSPPVLIAACRPRRRQGLVDLTLHVTEGWHRQDEWMTPFD